MNHHLSYRILLSVFVLLLFSHAARATETIPPAPAHYFNDYASILSPAAADQLDRQLEQFERDTSNQVRVVIYPKMLSDSPIELYTVHIAEIWHIGMKGKDNGAILFVFIQDRKAFIQVGYGLEGALPDATCKRIIDESLAPGFKLGQYEPALRAAVAGMLAATKSEFHGSGHTADDESLASLLPWILAGLVIIALPGVFLFSIHRWGGTFYGRHVRSLTFAENSYMFFLNLGLNIIFSGGSSGGGGGSSSGGGSFGGGGAGGSW